MGSATDYERGELVTFGSTTYVPFRGGKLVTSAGGGSVHQARTTHEHESGREATHGREFGPGATLWFLSELYYPEETSTGYFLTKMAEGLATSLNVGVLCAQPTYSQRGIRAPWHEYRRGVEIWRCRGTALDKNVLALRLINTLSISGGVLFSALRRVRRGDVVLAVTNPPTLPLLAALVTRAKHAKSVVLVHDVYPDVLVRLGVLRDGSALERGLRSILRRAYRGAAGVIVLGRDMKSLMARRFKIEPDKVTVIPNWADCDEIFPMDRSGNPLLLSLGISDKFVVQWAGNMGRTHDLECLLGAAEILREHRHIHFLFSGWGARRAWLEAAVVRQLLPNVSLVPDQLRDGLSTLLNACDISAISFVPGMAGISVPSRMYNVLAAGKPLVASADEASELSVVIREEGVGWVVTPGDAAAMARAILEAQSDPERVTAMGKRARSVAETKYSFEGSKAKYNSLFAQLLVPQG
jgi:colanic acid biosynthesis glycosyl transferase WcaI